MSFRHEFRSEKIKYMPTHDPITVDVSTPLAKVLKLIQEMRYVFVAVTRDDRLAGIMTDTHWVHHVMGGNVPLTDAIGDHMLPPPERLSPEDSVGKGMDVLQQSNLRHVPLTDDDGRVIGVLTIRRILGFLADEFPAAVMNQPPNLAQVTTSAEGA